MSLLRTLYSPPGDDDPADDVVRRLRPVRLYELAHFGAAERRLSDDLRVGANARRQSGGDGLFRRRAARTCLCDDSRHRPDDIAVVERLDRYHDAVRSRPQYRRRCPRRAVADHRDAEKASAAASRPPELQKGGPVRRAGPGSVAGIVDPAAVDDGRLCRADFHAADLAAPRGRAGPCLRRAEICRPHRCRFGSRGGARTDIERRRQCGDRREFDHACRRPARRDAERDARCPWPASARRGFPLDRRRLEEWRAGPRQRRRQCHRFRRERPDRRLVRQ